MEQISLKDEEITKLQKENKSLEKENKEYQEKNAKLKDILIGRPALQSTQHYLWDLIAVEVAKICEEMKRLEAKKAYIYSTLDKCTLAREKLQQLLQKPLEKVLSAIKFLKFSSDDALRNFNIPDRFQMILKAPRIVDKDNEIQKVKAKIETLQKEIKELYVLFMPMIEKGLPHFWDENNCLLKKEAYDN